MHHVAETCIVKFILFYYRFVNASVDTLTDYRIPSCMKELILTQHRDRPKLSEYDNARHDCPLEQYLIPF
jgi:hypothetical protein